MSGNDKKSVNPLFTGGAQGAPFSIQQSFGGPAVMPLAPQPTPSTQGGPLPPPPPPSQTPPTSNPSSVGPPPISIPPSLMPAGMQVAPPPSGLFLLPQSSTSTAAPTSSISSARKSRYVPPPGIHSTISSTGVTSPPGPPSGMGPLPSMPGMPPMPPAPIMPSVPPVIGGGTATPDGAGQSSTVFQPPVTTPQGVQKSEPEALVYHWFYLHRDNKDVIDTMTHFDDVVSHDSNRQRTPPSQSANTVNQEEVWKPFSMIDNVAIEDGLESGDELTPVPVDGGRYDVSIKDRTKNSVFWKEDYPCPIRRCSWFYQSNVTGRWVPYSEPLAQEFEAEYNAGFASGSWSRKLELEEPGEYVMFHSSTVMLHFPKTSHSKLDDWGQVQPPADPMMKPRVMHRGLEGLPEIPDGDVPGQFDHLVFVVHGIGAACDMKFQSVVGATTTMRQMVNEMSERHFSYAHMAGKASRIEFLPVNWHATLHGEDTGTDQRMKALTLRSIPKLRGFVNDTILDVLFYTSPVYCQRIIDTVISEINRMYTLFMARNEDFSGEVSMAGHSLGSLILFDILCNQDPTGCSGQSGPVSSSTEGGGAATIAGQVIETITGGPADHNLAADPSIQTVEHLFDKLCIGKEHLASFDGIDLEALMTSRSEDLKEAGLPEEANKAIMKFIQQRKTAKPDDKVDGLEAYQKASVTSDIKYTIGPAGTGQPSVKYQQLLFKVSAFYALGSPIGCFMAVRGLDYLGPSFKFPTCRRFFNIFHPYDAIAFRFEALIDKEYGTKLKPVTIPHHKGRKRMHLELKDTVTKLMTSDFKQKLINSAWAALGSVYNTVTGSTDQAAAAALEESMEKTAAKEEEEDANNPTKINSELNEGNRIDYALQEAPFETFNEYVFALSSHLCYWESEDTFLFMLKDIYGQMDVLPDDQVAGMAGGQDTFGGGSASVPTFVESPTPTLINNSLQQRPSATPTLVNNQLQTSSTPTLVNNQLQTSSTPTLVNNQLQTSTPTLVNNQLQSPTPTLVNNQLQSPTPTLVNNQLKTTPTPTLVNSQLQPTATTGSQPPQQQTLTNVPLSPPSTSVGPPPLMMAPSAVGPPPTTGGFSSRNMYPTPSSTGAPVMNSPMGMDPTVPVQRPAGTSVPPPPMSGFVRK